MKLFADENVAHSIVLRLREHGHEVLYAAEAEPGADDTDWLGRAEAEGMLILTSDKDFGDLIFRDGLTSHGVVLLRLNDVSLADRLARLEAAWAIVEANPVGRFIVITPNKVRIRRITSIDDASDSS